MHSFRSHSIYPTYKPPFIDIGYSLIDVRISIICYQQNKNLPSTKWDERQLSISRYHPDFPPKAGHLVLTNISLPCNAGIASGTSDVPLGTCSRWRLRRELRLVSDECNFQQLYYTSLAASASLLSSVIAFKLGRLLRFIICKNGGMSRLGFCLGLAGRFRLRRKR